MEHRDLVMNETVVRRLAALKASLDSGTLSPMATGKAKRTLGRLAYEYPKEAASLGVIADHSLALVYQYGVLLSDCTFPSEDLQLPDPANPRTAMRLRIAYYNALVEAARPLLEERRLLLSGPKQSCLAAINREISAKYAVIRAINRRSRKRVKSEEVSALLATIAHLKDARQPLWEPARREMKRILKEKKTELAQIDNRLFTQSVKRAREEYGPNGKGLWHGNYVKTEEEFRNAWKRVCHSPVATLHYRYEHRDGTPPEAPTSWEGWDGAGAITASTSQTGIPKDLGSITAGGHPRIQISNLDRSTWLAMGGDPRYLERDTSRLYVCRIRVGSKGRRKEAIWARAVFVMHRPIPSDARIAEASLIRKAVGFRHEEMLSICITTKAQPHRTAGRRVTFALGQFPKVATWFDDAGGQGALQLPPEFQMSMQALATLQSLIATYENATLAQIDVLGDDSRPHFEKEFGFHTRTRHGMKQYYEYWSRQFTADLCAEWKACVRRRLQTGKSHDKERIFDAVEQAQLLIAPDIQKHSGLNEKTARLFAALLVFHERYKHLQTLSLALRARRLRQRKDTYRKFGNQFRDAMTFVLPNDDLRTRHASESKILAAPSELIDVLEHFARREGIQVEWKRKTTDDSSAKVTARSSGAPASHDLGSAVGNE